MYRSGNEKAMTPCPQYSGITITPDDELILCIVLHEKEALHYSGASHCHLCV